jgi:hypothetical protein
MKRFGVVVMLMLCFGFLTAQVQEKIYDPYIQTVQFYANGNPLAYPVVSLGGLGGLTLEFDDLGGGVKNYSYTYQLCNADWKPALLSEFDYIKGFSQQRITRYKPSSVSLVRYTHYTASLPEGNCMPSRSGNYLLKVFKDGDTSKLLFTRKLLVVDLKADITAMVQQPYNGLTFNTHQKINFQVELHKGIQLMNHLEQIKVVILQNERWDIAKQNIVPTFVAGGRLEFNAERDAVFPAGKEWRWLDLRSLRFLSDRMKNIKQHKDYTEVFLKEDGDRSGLKINFFRDNNGGFFVDATESIDPVFQGDYAKVHFTYVPSAENALTGKEVYVIGKMNNYSLDPAAKMVRNANGVYTTDLVLKQGYYDYGYVVIDPADPKRQPLNEFTEGNYWDTENNYTILVYFRPIAGRADELIGYTVVNSLDGNKISR